MRIVCNKTTNDYFEANIKYLYIKDKAILHGLMDSLQVKKYSNELVLQVDCMMMYQLLLLTMKLINNDSIVWQYKQMPRNQDINANIMIKYFLNCRWCLVRLLYDVYGCISLHKASCCWMLAVELYNSLLVYLFNDFFFG